VRGFLVGISLEGGGTNTNHNNLVEDINADINTAYGVTVGAGQNNTVRNCIVTGTGGSTAPGTSGWASAGIALGSSTSFAINNSVTGTTPTSGATVSYGLYVSTDGRAVSNQVVGIGDTANVSNMCFAFGTGVLYKNNAASRCGTLYSGGIAVGGTNHP